MSTIRIVQQLNQEGPVNDPSKLEKQEQTAKPQNLNSKTDQQGLRTNRHFKRFQIWSREDEIHEQSEKPNPEQKQRKHPI